MTDQVWNSQPLMIRVLGTDVFANLTLASAPREGEEQVLEHLSTTVAEKKNRQLINHERKDIRVARLSPKSAFVAKYKPPLRL